MEGGFTIRVQEGEKKEGGFAVKLTFSSCSISDYEKMAQNKEIELYVLKQHTAAVNAVSFYDKDRRFVSASDDCSICVWDTLSREFLYRLKGSAF